MIRRIIISIFVLISAGYLYAQESDFGIWLEIDASHKLVKNLDLNLSGEIRTYDNSSKVRQVFGEGGLEYSISKKLSLAGNYRLISRREDDGYFYWRHRISGDLQMKLPVSRLDFLARLRLQRTTRTYIEDEEDLNAAYVWRLRLKTRYNTKGFPVNPWLYYESFSPAFSGDGLSIEKYRIALGADISLKKKMELRAGYFYQYDSERRLKNLHVLTLGFGFKF